VRLLYAEALKVRTAPRTLLGLVLALVALAALGAGSSASSDPGSSFVPNGDEILLWDVISVATTGLIFALILGILIVTWEYRHGTITQTFLATPRRERVMLAKYGVSFAAGALLAMLAVVAALVTALFWISISPNEGQWQLIGRLVLASALWGTLGAGLGAVLQSQVGAIVTAFVWFLVAEPLIGSQFQHFADYLPGGVIDRLTTRGELQVGEEGPQWAFSLWGAALLATAYALGVAALGAASAIWRDVS
jgi:ABC-2 type transport system permease protein